MFREYFIDPLLDTWHFQILPGVREFLGSPLMWKMALLLVSILILFKALGRKRIT
jgi:hypothetical protein